MLLNGGGACFLLFLVGVVDEKGRDSNKKLPRPVLLVLLLLVLAMVLLLLLLVMVLDGRECDANK
jgi:hypothetical protein